MKNESWFPLGIPWKQERFLLWTGLLLSAGAGLVLFLCQYLPARRALYGYNGTVGPDGAVVRWERGWGEVHPEEFGLHLGGAEELTRPVLRMLALEWERLREENAPLRAVVNGRVMGVSEDFYDPVLRRCLTEKPQKVANVLGQALVQLSGVGDWLLARRLRAMAEAGAVRVDEAGSTRGFYGAAVCLA